MNGVLGICVCAQLLIEVTQRCNTCGMFVNIREVLPYAIDRLC